MAANHDLDELSVEERRRRIVTILAAGLVRLSRSGGLSQKADQDGSNSSPISADSANSRLESSSESGLTVHNG